MPLELTNTAQAILDSEDVKQAITLEIDGIAQVFSTASLDVDALYGAGLLYGTSGLVYGGGSNDSSVVSLISLGGTSYNITQQLRVDRADVSSVQKIAVNMVDEGEYFTFNFAPGQLVDDIMGRDAIIRIAFIDGTYPDDSVVLVNGKIDQVEFGAGFCTVQVANSLDLSRTTVFESITTELDGAINSVQNPITVDDASNILLPRTIFGDIDTTLETYIRIDDEIMRVSSIAGNDITLVPSAGNRTAQFGTTADTHDDGATVETIYRLQDNAVDLALKLLLSNEDESNYASGVAVSSFVQTAAGVTANAISFLDQQIQTNLGVAPGDYITSVGASNAANNFTNAIVQSVQQTDDETIIILENNNQAGSPVSLVLEDPSSATLTFVSQYNVLPIKSLLKPKNVDVARFQEIKDASPSSLLNYDFMLTDTISSLKDFLSNQIYKPGGFFNLPRKGRLSVGLSQPPLNTAQTKILTASNVKNADKIKVSRTTNKNFFNGVSYDFEESRIESGKFLKRIFTISADSIARISTRNSVLAVTAEGLRDDADTNTKINRQITRYLQRFQFGAESMTVDVLYKTGFPVEIGDSIVVDGSSLQISDSVTGSRNGSTRVFEIVNKKMNIVNGTVSLDLLDTSFSSRLRFGVISQSSLIDSGATTTLIPIKPSFGSANINEEIAKYSDYIGQVFRVRNNDFTFNEECTLISISGSSLNVTALSAPPSEDFIVESPDYGNGTALDKSLWKGIHAFMTPQVDVVSGVDNFSFTVAPADLALFSLNQPIEVHNDDYSITSNTGVELALVSNIDGGTNTITVDRDLGFTPAASQKVEFIGFSTDGGLPYALS